MHPDIVAQYNYVFLWDEDLGVENFHAERCSFLILHFLQEYGYHVSVLANNVGG